MPLHIFAYYPFFLVMAMRTRSKRIKLNVEEDDRLSSLHDDLLIHILSFLDVTYAAQTCVLSKRWNTDFWVHHPDVYLNGKTFGKTSYRFIKFVDSVLSQRDKLGYNVRSFSFVWTFVSRIPQTLLDRVHSHAQSRDVRHFNLSLGCASRRISYPSEKFCPKSLISLRLNLLNMDVGIGGHGCVEFSAELRNLYLSCCTSLKTLWLANFFITLKIGNENHFSRLVNLTELGTVNCSFTGFHSNNARFCIPKYTPKLERLIILRNSSSIKLLYDTKLHQPRYIEDIEIDFQSHKDYRASYYARRLINIVRYPPRAQSYTLSESTLQVKY